ncbi:MAG: Ig-like domain-containing protein [Acidobacteriaceae bacterium]
MAAAAPVVARTTTAVTSNPTLISAGGSVTLTATVASSSGTPTGAVTFSSGGASLGTANLSGGVATLPTTALPVGADTITASYGGAATFAVSSGTTNVTVTAATPAGYTVVPTSPTLNTTQGQTVSTTLTLNPTGGYSGTVVFSCQNLPANAACVFAKNPVQLTGNNQPVQVGLTIETNVQVARVEASPTPTQSPLSPILPALAFWPKIPFGSRSRVFVGRESSPASSPGSE